MSSNESELQLDTSGMRVLPSAVLKAAKSLGLDQDSTPPFCKVYGFKLPDSSHNASAACALASIFDYYQIGWSHLPKNKDGHPENDIFVQEIMRWGELLDLDVNSDLSTSPQCLLRNLQRAGLEGIWYANGSEQDTLSYIRMELCRGRPVMALLNMGHEGKMFRFEWHVVFQLDQLSVYTKSNRFANKTIQWSQSEFNRLLLNKLPDCNRTIIKIQKPNKG